jgi:hypothetical protein
MSIDTIEHGDEGPAVRDVLILRYLHTSRAAERTGLCVLLLNCRGTVHHTC